MGPGPPLSTRACLHIPSQVQHVQMSLPVFASHVCVSRVKICALPSRLSVPILGFLRSTSPCKSTYSRWLLLVSLHLRPLLACRSFHVDLLDRSFLDTWLLALVDSSQQHSPSSKQLTIRLTGRPDLETYTFTEVSVNAAERVFNWILAYMFWPLSLPSSMLHTPPRLCRNTERPGVQV